MQRRVLIKSATALGPTTGARPHQTMLDLPSLTFMCTPLCCQICFGCVVQRKQLTCRSSLILTPPPPVTGAGAPPPDPASSFQSRDSCLRKNRLTGSEGDYCTCVFQGSSLLAYRRVGLAKFSKDSKDNITNTFKGRPINSALTL